MRLRLGIRGGSEQGPSRGIVVTDSKPIQPPVYDFKDGTWMWVFSLSLEDLSFLFCLGFKCKRSALHIALSCSPLINF